ncbi:MAG: efflux RND transporter permease subunit, partial [Myxococcota bacterium]
QMSLPTGMNLNDRISIKNDAVRVTVLWTISTSQEVVKRIEQIEKMTAEMGLNVVVTGKNRILHSMNGYVVHSLLTSLGSALILISVTIALFFRSLTMGLLAMLPNTIPLAIGGSVLYALDKPIDIGTALVTSVVLGIAVDDTIHVISNFQRLRREGRSRTASIADILSNTTPALVTTSVILVSTFGIFTFGTFTPNIYFGLTVAIILTVALAIDLTFLPALLAWNAGDKKARRSARTTRSRKSRRRQDAKAVRHGPKTSEHRI